jgi:hypothetical protein
MKLLTRSLFLILLIAFCQFAHAQTGTVKGRVFEDETKEAVLGARVELLKAKRNTIIQDITGEFTFLDVLVGSDTLQVTGVGYSTKKIPIAIAAGSVAIVNIELKESEEQYIYENGAFTDFRPCIYNEPFIIKPSMCTVAGKICEANSEQPIPRAAIDVSYRYADSSGLTHVGCCMGVVSDSLGRFVMENLFPGQYHLIATARKDSYAPKDVRVMAVADSLYRINFYLSKEKNLKVKQR